MAIARRVAGLTTVKIDAGQGAGIESLGYTQDGAEIEFTTFWEDVYGDQNGGTNGPPIDTIDLGQIATVRLLLTSWETTVADKIHAVVPNGTAGTAPTPGTLLFTTSARNYRVLLDNTNFDFNFPTCLIRDTRTFNVGTKHSKLLFVFTAYHPAGGGTLWNTTMT